MYNLTSNRKIKPNSYNMFVFFGPDTSVYLEKI